ncbi:Lsr2 family protein [Jatrophihabitans endophyticus]|uniref:histone-like nucleoid-structuring protein Lsr2 n=1 Tax=Jatrophihabitans endophyticus TaxID=1206085 RepID=UPI0019F7F91B|nr:Lsr2 family protein [Jatrophihabitans endophyticus]MBE7186908.1 Lsr2 family protein [Jatrophihabitans endophyticus]
MAQTVITTDDLDGSAEATTVEFAFDGTGYSIDLSKKNRAAFEKALKPYIDAATPTTRRRSRAAASSSRSRGSRRGGSGRTDTAAVRAWAAEQGIEVSERGRISGEIVEAYRAAH